MFVLGMEFGQDFVGFVCFLRAWIWVWIWSRGSVSLLGFRSFPIFLPILSSLLSTGYLGLGGFRAFVCFLFSSALSNWFVHFVWNALGQRGSVGTGFGPVAFGLRLGHEAGGLRPPLASPAPTSLACPHAEE